MLHQIYNIPSSKHFILACSAGVDSMSIADFYKRGGKKFTLAYFDHGTGNGQHAIPLLCEWSDLNNIPLVIGKIQVEKPKDQSYEEFWRNERYRWLCSLGISDTVIMAHHLGDVVEGYIFSCLHGNPKIMKHQSILSSYGNNKILYRPFLTTTKDDLVEWATRHEVQWYEDQSNKDIHYPRNFIRNNLLAECLKVNPGLFKTIKKKILATVNT